MDNSKRFDTWAIFRYMHSPKILWSYRYELMNDIMCIACQWTFIPSFMVGWKLVPSQSWNSDISRSGVWPVPRKMVLQQAWNAWRLVHEIGLSTAAQFCNEFWLESMPRWKLRMWPTPVYCRCRNEAGISGTNLRTAQNPSETVKMDIRKGAESSISFISLQVNVLQTYCWKQL
jgi:hypothetical protein